ncbi:MAG: molybdopterin molybdotransferase MoeA [Acidobacteriota bacterium]|jgi:molybdopterin molybdotransferase|nr:molybdopterin molybdotransferase MoeA [Acidobacteriota bacterium]
MISIEEALEILLRNIPAPKTERIPFYKSLGRVLAEDIVATSDIPPFNRATMDGFAVRSADVQNAPVELILGGEARAGGGIHERLRPGEAIYIMTGAPVPDGADAVQIVEVCPVSPCESKVTVMEPVAPGDNIAPKGREAMSGDVIIKAGRVAGPAEIALMATFGYAEARVYAKPSVAILSTGDELVEFDETPRADQIRNSNAYCLAAQLKLLGIEADYLGIARDEKEDLRGKILAGLERDVLIITGGVSMGEYDFVRDVFEELGVEILFSKVAIKPGKPTVFARKGNRLVFGLPGNPLSSMITFECFARPVLGRMCGIKRPELKRVQGVLLEDVRQTPGRTAFLPARIEWTSNGWSVRPISWKNSADMIGFSGANATLIFPGELAMLSRGETVEIMLLPDFFAR